jgi:ketosteroid isomerase-like protein
MSQKNVEFVRQGFERTARGDWAIADRFDPQVEFVLVGGKGLGLTEEGRGIDELMGVLLEFMSEFEDYRVEGEQFIALDNDRVFVLGRDRGVGRASGAPFEHENGQVFTLRDGCVVRWEVYWNRDEARKAAGLSD